MNARILLLALGTFIIGTETFMIAGLLPAIAEDFHVSLPVAGQLVTAFSLVYAIGSPVLMTMTGRAERRTLLVWSLVAFAAGNAVCGFAFSYEMMLAGRMLAAAAAGLFAPAASAAAAGLVSVGERGRALSIVIGGGTIALILGVPIGTYLALAFHWKMPFWIVGAGSLLAAALIRRLFPVVPSPGAVSLKDRLSFLKHPVILCALLTTLLWGTAIFSVYTYIADLYSGLGAAGRMISLVLLVGGIAGFIGVSLGGYAADKIGSARTVALALVVLTVSLAGMSMLYSVADSRGVLAAGMVAVALYGLSGYAFNPAQQHQLIGWSGPSTAIVLSLNASAIYLGSAWGAFLGGVVLKYGSVAMLGYLGGLGSLSALISFGLTRRLEARTTRSERAMGDERAAHARSVSS
ncbi:MAG TPA: MFS transporter [Longimicrobiales bacterium]